MIIALKAPTYLYFIYFVFLFLLFYLFCFGLLEENQRPMMGNHHLMMIRGKIEPNQATNKIHGTKSPYVRQVILSKNIMIK